MALLAQAIVTLVRLAKPGGLRSVVAEAVQLRHQLQILNRGRPSGGLMEPQEGREWEQ